MLTCSSSFAQKEELKDLERAYKRNNTEEVGLILNKIKENLPNATDDQKAAYYFYKAQNEIRELNNEKENIFYNLYCCLLQLLHLQFSLKVHF